MIKTGSQHIAALKDGRQVYIDGELAGVGGGQGLR